MVHERRSRGLVASMSGRLVHVPFDRGIDENVDTAGAAQSTGLARCVNLWHSREGVLSPRPGTQEREVTIDSPGAVNLIGNASGANLVMVDGTLYADNNGTGIATGSMQPFSPLGAWSLYSGQMAIGWDYLYHEGRHYVAAPVPNQGVHYSVFDAETRVLISHHFLSGAYRPTLVPVTGGVALYGSKFSDNQKVFHWDTATWVSTEIDNYAGFVDMARAATDGTTVYLAVAASGSPASIHVYSGSVATPTTLTEIEFFNTDTFIFPVLMRGATFVLANHYSGQILVHAYSGGIELGSSPVSDVGTGTFSIVDADDGTPGFWVTTSDAGTVYRWRLSDSLATLVPQEVMLAGATAELPGFAANGTSYVWGTIPTGLPIFSTRVLLDIQTGEIAARASFSPLRYDGRPSVFRDGAWESVLPEYGDNGGATQIATIRIYRHGDIADGNGEETSTRQLLQFNGSGFIPGEQLMQWQGGQLLPSLPLIGPEISVAAGTTGSLTPSSTYQYVAVFFYTDEFSAAHNGTPSQVATVDLAAGEDSVTVSVDPSDTFGDPWRVAIYRTEANGTVFYLLTDSVRPGESYEDIAADTSISDNAIFYTESGELAHDAAPASRFGCVGKLRLWLAGQDNPFRVSFSMESLRGEVPAFPDFPGYFLDFDATITGLAAIDDTVIVFTEREAYLVTGDGPDRIGNGSFQVRPIGMGIGCSDWRSVCTTPSGVFFGGNQTIWLLPRGFAAPLNIGAQITDTLRAYPITISAVLADYGEQQAVHFLLKTTGDYTGGYILTDDDGYVLTDDDGYISIGDSDARHMVYGLRSQQWYQWQAEDYSPLVAGLMRVNQADNGTPQLVYSTSIVGAGDSALIRHEETWQPFDVPATGPGVLPSVAIETHQWHPWGLTGEAALARMWWRVRVDEEQSAWSWTQVSAGNVADPLSMTPMVGTGWQNLEVRAKWSRIPELSVSLAAGSAHFAGVTYEVTAEGFAKEPTARRTG